MDEGYKRVVNLSGGVCSFWALHRVIEQFGKTGVVPVFADVKMEDEDLYRFLSDIENHFGIPVVRIADGRTPWDLFEEKGMIANSRFPFCSVILKREMLDNWRKSNCIEWATTLYIGIDWTESNRLTDTRAALPGWDVQAPMCEAPYWDKCKMQTELTKLGIRVPRLYGMDFPHNNCGGFCVKAGQAHFVHLLKTMPERYAFHEAKEEALRARIGDWSILTDRRGDGKKKPLTLRALRLRVEAGEEFDRHDWGGCGCSLDSINPETVEQTTV